MNRAKLIQAVVLRMDEITPDAGLSVAVDGADGNPLYELVGGLLDDGALELFSTAQYWRLPQTAFAGSAIGFETVGARKVLRLKLGDDFLRVAEISCPDFKRPVTEVFPEQTPEGKRQHNPFLMGKEAKPVGVLSHGTWNGAQCREIDCYSLPSGSTTTASDVVASYIAKPAEITGSVTIEDIVPEILIPALEWIVAAKAFGARGDVNHAAVCQQNANNLLI